MTFIQDLAILTGIAFAAGLIFIATRKSVRSKGKNVVAHGIYAAVIVASFFLFPGDAKEVVFSNLAVVVVGTVLPVYESLRAVCTIEGADDTTWLTYWIAQGIVSFSTEWVDGLGNNVSIGWNMFEFFFYLWLVLPWTDGAHLIFSLVLDPLVAPIIQPFVNRADGIINKIITAVTNAAHLYFVWIIFMFLPAGLKRAIWILLATVYPMASSIVSVTTPEEADDTFWLTYWSCFGILFLIVDMLENFVGFIPGFYTIAIIVTVYLMLPLFRGAEQVFRTILVPLAGLQEMLVRKDAARVRQQALKDLPPDRRDFVLKEIAKDFAKPAATKPVAPVSPTGYSQIV